MKADTYKTLRQASPKTVFKDRGSKFIGMAFPVKDIDEVKNILKQIKSSYHDARHWCYAYRLGKQPPYIERANDDGEPSHSAGAPILNQIRSFDLTDTLVVVVRYFGGVKLGVSGLINAYKTAAKSALEQSEIVEKEILIPLEIYFPYEKMNEVMRYIKKNNIRILERGGAGKAYLKLGIRPGIWEEVREKMDMWL